MVIAYSYCQLLNHVQESHNIGIFGEKVSLFVPLFNQHFKCPMKSCETKVTLSNVENHISTGHPDVYNLIKRILMDEYGISKTKCDLCGFCFQTEADYESHLGTFSKFTFKSSQPSLI